MPTNCVRCHQYAWRLWSPLAVCHIHVLSNILSHCKRHCIHHKTYQSTHFDVSSPTISYQHQLWLNHKQSEKHYNYITVCCCLLITCLSKNPWTGTLDAPRTLLLADYCLPADVIVLQPLSLSLLAAAAAWLHYHRSCHCPHSPSHRGCVACFLYYFHYFPLRKK